MRLVNSKPPGPWHEAYQPIEDPAADLFVSNVLERATAGFGEPVVPVNQVMLRRSKKTEAAKNYRIGENFSLTECIDATNGVFVIYLAVDPGHGNFFPLLGHECAHLLNPFIFDWYMEGIATEFSERMCAETGREWGDWKRHFQRSRREPYALSYRMMLELKAAFPAEYPRLIRHTAQTGKGPDRRHIDIDAWLATLPVDRRETALGIIGEYATALRRAVSAQYYFTVPDALQ